jgi:photosystem II stability/assembly factor-like uncharacterized protein
MSDFVGFTWRKTNAPTGATRTDDIWFNDELTGWAVNSNGEILKTEDGGASWIRQALLRRSYLRCVAFANAQIGWVGTLSGEHRLYRTLDGGATWQPVTNLPDGPPARICGLSVVDERTIYASGTNYPNQPPAVLKSEDGGSTWTTIDMSGHAALLVDIYFRDSSTGWVVGGEDVVKHPGRQPDRDDVIPTVLHTTDGGRSWTNVAGATGLRRRFPRGEWGWKIQVLDEDTLFVSLENMRDGALLRSDDGGASWRRLPVNDRQRNANLEGIGFIDRQRGWVGGWGDQDFQGGFTSATSDGGANWDNANEVGLRLNRFRFIGNPPRVAYASGDTVYKFTDEPVAVPPAMLVAAADRSAVEADEREGGIAVDVPEDAGELLIEIWERFGRHVRTLADEAGPAAGSRRFQWDFTDADGDLLPAGPYIVRIVVDGHAESRILQRAE